MSPKVVKSVAISKRLVKCHLTQFDEVAKWFIATLVMLSAWDPAKIISHIQL
jgi:hypothetical protein